MPSPAHETLILQVAERPALLGELVQRLLGKAAHEPLHVVDSALRLADPIEVRPDLVLEGEHSWVILEVQSAPDDDKARRWPVAASILVNKHGRMGDVVVITHSEAVAAWSAHVAVMRGPWDSELALRPKVLLLNEQNAALLLDPEAPHLAFFAAWAMQERHGPAATRVVEQAIAVSERLDPDLRRAQVRAIFNVLSPAMLEMWRQRMETQKTAPESPQFKAFREWLEARGEARGVALGEARGEARGEAKILLRLLEKREFVVSPERRAQVLACTEVEQIESWVDRVLSAQTIEDVLR